MGCFVILILYIIICHITFYNIIYRKMFMALEADAL